MKFWLSALLVFLFAAAAAGYCAGADRWAERRRRAEALPLNAGAMLWAIRQVESGDNPHAVGRLGERSAYQFMPYTWVRYTNAPFVSWASDPQVAHKVARAHLTWLCGQLTARGHVVCPELVAAAWRHGPGGAAKHMRSDYARRTANLYWEFNDRAP